MNNEIFIDTSERLTLQAYIPIASQTMSLIAEAAEGVAEIEETFSITDLSVLLNKVCAYIPGEFEIRRTPSNYCQIVYESYAFDEGEFEEMYTDIGFVDMHDTRQDCLWINEKVFIAFIDRKLYGLAFMLYFYLGHLMTRDASFSVSHNISFEKIVESCDMFPESCRVKYRTTLMRALSDLQDAGLVKWNAKGGTFEMLHITPYDPTQKV